MGVYRIDAKEAEIAKTRSSVLEDQVRELVHQQGSIVRVTLLIFAFLLSHIDTMAERGVGKNESH